jgi:hypothetical protein
VSKDCENPSWYGPVALKSRTFKDSSPVKAACDIFGDENVRFYGGGIPEVFLDNGKVTDTKVDELLTWRPA